MPHLEDVDLLHTVAVKRVMLWPKVQPYLTQPSLSHQRPSRCFGPAGATQSSLSRNVVGPARV
jgi:hypothetical protein